MTKNEYLEQLQASLRRGRVSDADDILDEYRQHFEFKMAEGYTEEEIAAKLGAPADIAAQYEEGRESTSSPAYRAAVAAGIIFLDIFVAAFFIMLGAWIICMGVSAVSVLGYGVCLIIQYEIPPIIPQMPYICAVIFALGLLAFSVLIAIGCVYFVKLFSQLKKSYFRFHHNVFAAAAGRPQLPSITVYPNFKAKTRRLLKKACLISVIAAIVLFSTGYIVAAVSAGTVEFWHAWSWFE